MKRFITGISAIVLTLSFVTICLIGCSSFFMKPADYTVVSQNIVWMEFENDKEIRKTSIIPREYYYKIPDVPINEYVACRIIDTRPGGDQWPVIMKHKDFEHSLELNIDSAKLFLGGCDVNFSEDDWLSYGQTIMKQEVSQIDSTLAEKLVNVITADSPEHFEFRDADGYFTDEYYKWGEEASYLVDSDGNILRLQFPIEQYDYLIWIACIVKYEESYFIEIKSEWQSDSIYLYCPDEFAGVIEKACEEYNLIPDSKYEYKYS